MCTLLQKSKAKSTNLTYARLFRRFQDWCAGNRFVPLPAEEITVLRFITYIVTSLRSCTQINAFLAAIVYFHELNGFTACTKTPRVKLLVEASLREYGRAVQKKELGNAVLVKNLISAFCSSNILTFDILQIIVFITLLYVTMSRFDCLHKVKISEVFICDSFARIFISKSKTDQRRQGDRVLFNSSIGSDFCPVKLLRLYLTRLRLLGGKNVIFLFPVVSLDRSVFSIMDRPMQYYSTLKSFRKLLSTLGYNPLNYGLHCFRAGRATDLANAGLSETDISILGRWKSLISVQGYVSYSDNHKLKLNRHLSL